MLEGDDVKLIDLGAVRRIGDPSGDVYGTLGYKAPEADDDPREVSDLFTVGRTLAVLLTDFDNTGRHAADLPAPDELLRVLPEGAAPAPSAPLPQWLRWNAASRAFIGTAPPGAASVEVAMAAGPPLTLTLPLASNESLYRFLLKATAAAPDARFQSADEMAAQLTGVLRETAARDAPVPAADSAVFLPERAAPGDPVRLEGAWRRLPELRLDQTDPAAAEIFAAAAAEPAMRGRLLADAARAKPQSGEARLRGADQMIAAGGADVEAVMRQLDQALAIDAFDWRPDWYCGKLYLSLGRAREAVECFDKVFSEIPGEPAPKLALAMALETEGRVAEAAGLYDTASRTDPSLAAAAFGLARCRLAQDDRAGAVSALGRVPDSAALSGEARLAAVRALTDGDPDEAALRQASDILAGLARDDVARHEAEAALATAAARKAEAGSLPRDGAALLGVKTSPGALRRRAEAALRICARLAEDRASRIAFVDRANAVRPRTLI